MPNQAALTIHRGIKRVPEKLLGELAGVPTGFIVDSLGRQGALDFLIRPMFDSPPFAGTALTVWTVPKDNLAPYAALEVAQPGDVLMIATGDWVKSAVVGDHLCAMAKNCGIAAIVTDGLARDIAGIIEVGLPVYARGLSPNSPHKNGPGTIGGHISLGGEVIHTGDAVIGDKDGVVAVPGGRVASVLENLKSILEKEAEVEALVRNGLKTPTWLSAMLSDKGVIYLD